MARTAILRISDDGPATFRVAGGIVFEKGRVYPLPEAEAIRFAGHGDFAIEWRGEADPPSEDPGLSPEEIAQNEAESVQRKALTREIKATRAAAKAAKAPPRAKK